MSGPMRVYSSNAERQRAYRERKAKETGEELFLAETTSVHAYALQAAVKVARESPTSDPVALKVYRDDPIETLRALIDHFHDQAGTPASERPWCERERRPRPRRGK